jgi:hypothetical protein
MADFERFRQEAIRDGLAGDGKTQPPWWPHQFTFNLPEGRLEVPDDPEKIMQLVQLAFEMEEDPRYGLHRSLLNLQLTRETAEQYTQYFNMPWNTRGNITRFGRYDPDVYMSLREWLELNGQDPNYVLAHATS